MPVSADLAQQITNAVDQGWDQQIAFTQDLIRYPSVRGQEHTAQDFLYKAFADRELAMGICERVRIAIEQEVMMHENNEISITVSIGLSCTEEFDPPIASSMIERADLRLYRAKEMGRNTTEADFIH